MEVLQEGELQFTFGKDWTASKLDEQGVPVPHGMAFVDFVLEGDDEIVLMEVKDPAASRIEGGKRSFAKRLAGEELVNEHLTPKARDSYTYLHLMRRDAKPMRFVLALGLNGMSVQEPLLMALNDRLRQRLRQEAQQPWKREYVTSCLVVPLGKIGEALPGCKVVRMVT